MLTEPLLETWVEQADDWIFAEQEPKASAHTWAMFLGTGDVIESDEQPKDTIQGFAPELQISAATSDDCVVVEALEDGAPVEWTAPFPLFETLGGDVRDDDWFGHQNLR
jgi:hypothetical protein